MKALANRKAGEPATATSICERCWSGLPSRPPAPKAAISRTSYRLKARRGSMRAALAIAHKILVAAYHMLAKGVGYREIGEACLDQISQTRTVANLKRRLERLGFHVTLQSKAQPAA